MNRRTRSHQILGSSGVVNPEFRCDSAWLVSIRGAGGSSEQGLMQRTVIVRQRIKH